MKKGIIKYNNLNCKCEDMYQIEYGDILLDVGYYNGIYKIHIIKKYDWENPMEVISFKNEELIKPFINILRKKIKLE